jgi:hypothetical protein
MSRSVSILVAGAVVLAYGTGLAQYVITIRAEVVPKEIRLVWPMRRTRSRLRPGPVTRLRDMRRGGLFETQLGRLGIEFGAGRIDDREPVSVLRLDPRVR